MDRRTLKPQFKTSLNVAILFVLFTFFSGYPLRAAYPPIVQDAPVPLLAKGHPVDWWFVFKPNSKAFPECGGRDPGMPVWRYRTELQVGVRPTACLCKQ